MGAIVKTEELARQLGVTPETVRRWARRGLIPSMRVSPKVIRFDVDEVARVLRDRGQQETETGSRCPG